MAAAPSAAQVAALVALVKQLFATSFIGFAIATTLYGISVLQVYLYYRNYPADHPALKGTVALLWVLDTLCTIFVAHSLYTYFVLNFGKSPTVDLIIPWSFTSEKFLVTLITFVAQCFYARTIWRVSGSLTLFLIVGVIAVVTFALGIVTTVHLFQNPLATAISARSFQILSGLVQGLAAFNDVLITVCLCIWLYRHKTGAGGWGMSQAFGTEKILDTLILYAVSRGVLTAVTQFLFLTLNLALPHATYWMPFHQAVGKLYVNSVLNVRSTFADVVAGPPTDFAFVDMPPGHIGTVEGLGPGRGQGEWRGVGDDWGAWLVLVLLRRVVLLVFPALPFVSRVLKKLTHALQSGPQSRFKPLVFANGTTATESIDLGRVDTRSVRRSGEKEGDGV
ncbi:hypothetical protein B0H17DRAFT_1210212 [Mycena rosella]|uniref:DUF6534 domain-containing protein n=1 Tax=Mycena rosella TaxID=1033263 RepID=A0AAD7G4U3_MYCRO|nr:hypothetical protein B0H17DRAFT_1210212 [Mycena rosella]